MEADRQQLDIPVRAVGKWLYAGDGRVLMRGATYGTFAEHGGGPFPSRDQVLADFAQMKQARINTVRTYTVPPRWLLDLAWSTGLRVMVGLPWEQHLTFLSESARADSIEARMRAGVRACDDHPAVSCYAIGNEIPASIVRFHGARRIERFLERLVRAVRQEAPSVLVTYVNYPSTEYLDLPFLDLVCFNVFLEEESDFEAYVARLQNLAGERPLLLTEVGLDSRRHGGESQARSVAGQLRTTYELGAAGAFVFSWTDEWHRGGCDVEDWDFGLVDRDRRPKPALAAVQTVFADPIGALDREWPRATVVVCSFNGGPWIRGCLDALAALEYPHYDVVVIDDGSTDDTAAIAREFDGVRVISTPNGGLSRARNIGLAAADGEIVAYVDDDTRAEPSWLNHLVLELLAGRHVAVGGPNLAPPDDGLVANSVAGAPGGPVHVLVTDREAEHVPGCNMAFHTSALRSAGGFDPAFRIAGDDVDVCWRLQDRGETIGFAASAVVWHHPRPTVRGYLRQQLHYGEAEALLERKWPQRYNRRGHVSWAGSVYGSSRAIARGRRRPRIRYGEWGSAPFQNREVTRPGWLSSLTLTPEWYLGIAALGILAALHGLWSPLKLALPLLLLAVGATALEAALTAARFDATRGQRVRWREPLRRTLTLGLYILQPAARLAGRLHFGLVPWRRRGSRTLRVPTPCTHGTWVEQWATPEQRLGDLEQQLADAGDDARRGGPYDRWDLEVRGGAFGMARVRAGIEEHGRGRQLVRLRAWPVPSSGGTILAISLVGLALSAYNDGARVAALGLGMGGLGLAAWCLHDCAAALGAFRPAVLERAFARRHTTRAAPETPGENGEVASAAPPPWLLAFKSPAGTPVTPFPEAADQPRTVPAETNRSQ